MTDPARLDADARKVKALTARIAPLMHGHPAQVQGATLADLTAMWLAGIQGEDGPAVREALLAMHVEAIRKLIPVNEAMILERYFGKKTPPPKGKQQ